MPRRSVLTAHQEIFRKICIASEKFTSVWRNSVFYPRKAAITQVFLETPRTGEDVRVQPVAGAVLLWDSRILLSGDLSSGWDWISQLRTAWLETQFHISTLRWLLQPLSWRAGELRYWVRGLRVVRQTFCLCKAAALHIEFLACHKFP